MLSAMFIVKALLIVAALSTVTFMIFRKTKSKCKPDDKFKHNIALLRKEKLLFHKDKKLEKKRQKLLRKSKNIIEKNPETLINKSKKLGVPTGEMLLASKIQMSCKQV